MAKMAKETWLTIIAAAEAMVAVIKAALAGKKGR
jgi:hypothetical protein